ncbi:MAG TPA: phosphonate metabolism protein/1,5-bisphosphokinase (PRPP-forming) PhnN [Rhizobiaceae bacterium]|nr:phosphonate metabolism protein/1,5-bisphosphokinase (PRPP-forming) PhnN [Rhizobiaceae bacterium]
MGRAGTFVAVVGPSGAGKDSLIRHAQSAFASNDRLMFVRRTVTRQADPGAEDHDSMSAGDFDAAEAAGAFAATWRAHGLAYGIPVAALDHVQQGGIAIANCSRGALPAIREKFGELVVIHVTAPPEVLAKRIAARGREPAAEIEARVRREASGLEQIGNVVTIDNGGELELAAARFNDCLMRLAEYSRP